MNINVTSETYCLNSGLNHKHNLTRSSLFLFFTLVLIFLIRIEYATAQSFPSGFSQVQVATGLVAPTIMTQSPDGRIFIAEQNGALKIFKNGALLSTPFVSLSVDDNGERGLLGIAFDPAFNSNQYIYLYYTLSSGSNNRISRFTANGDVVVPGSVVVILNLDPLTSATNHNGGTMQFGPDGKLYVGVGDNANSNNPQDLDTYHGKVLRINSDGTPASGNPFSTGSLQRRSIWSYGLRNPYTLTFQPATGKLFVNDVGQFTWEEINDCTTGGGNYGWPDAEGISSNPAYVNPVYAYSHGSGSGQGCAITGGTFFNPSSTNYPSQYSGNYFFIDYCGNWIDRLTISGSTATRSSFATSIAGSPVGIIAASDGNLYFLSRSTNSLYRVEFSSGAAPVITSQPQSITVSQGNAATFNVTASGTGLNYQWRKNTNDINGANAATYTISNVSSGDAGNYSVVVSNSSGSTTSNTAVLTVNSTNNSPVAVINTPSSGATYTAGTTINFSGSATDNEDGTLGASSFVWFVDFHHDTHTHPGPSAPDGVLNGSFNIPNTGETSANVFYRLYLVVTDSQGAKDTTYTDINPKTTTITINSNPVGLQLTLDGQPFNAPLTFVGVEGILRTIGGPSQITLNNGATYNFVNWSQGGSQLQTFSTPVNDATYTANYSPELRNAEYLPKSVNGLNYKYFEGTWNTLPDFETTFPLGTGNSAYFDLTISSVNDYFGFRFNGYIFVPTDGIYTFYTSSDDGSKLYIGSTLVVDNDGAHAVQELSGQIGLKSGLHAIYVDYFDRAGQEILEVRYEGPGIAKQLIPASVLFRADPTVVLNPVADAYIRSGTEENTNFGTNGKLITKKGYSNGKYETCLRFDVSSIPTNIISAKLRLFGSINNNSVATIPVAVFNVPDNSWQETTITFATKPANSKFGLDTVDVSGTNSVYYEWDITEKLNELRLAGISMISLKLKNISLTLNSRVNFNSRESNTNKPELVVYYNTPIAVAPLSKEESTLFVSPEVILTELFPQPAKDFLRIESSDESSFDVISIVDMNGKNMAFLNLTGGDEYEISLDGISPGIYFLEVRRDMMVERKKFIVIE
ncbi:MAG: PQQ-dependent sugar dehydrogenase [Bacteroidetes bacterium]|nr:PQQ-dependent sugar dehydrogenase [Bacteroidota bacterium]